ncbi:MAG: hypothetical protein J7D61_17945, partial [Marichromatium sp.]|nr:hypothetical protein [Marichromatium sp.]
MSEETLEHRASAPAPLAAINALGFKPVRSSPPSETRIAKQTQDENPLLDKRLELAAGLELGHE